MRIVIVGAGIFGASVAYHLSARPGVEVVVIDRAHPGKATLAGAGIVCPWATKVTEPDFYRFYAAGGAFYRPLIAALREAGEQEVGFRQVGALLLAQTEADLVAIEARVLPRVAEAPEAGEARRVDPKEARTMFPPLREGLSGLFISGGARVEARTLAAAMMRVAVARGARVVEGEAEMTRHGEGLRIGVDGRDETADIVVLTAGAWTNQLLVRLGLAVPVEPQRGQIAHFSVRRPTQDWPVLLPQTSHYMLAFDDERVVAGATREVGSGFEARLTAGGQAEVINFALDLAPGLRDATHIETRVGIRPMGDDNKPLIGKLPGYANVLVGNGLGAGGLTMGPLAGHLVASLALGETPDFDLSPYAVRMRTAA